MNIFFKSLLVPGSLSLIIIIIGLLLTVKKKKSGKIILTLGVLIYYFFSTTPGSNILLGPLESGLRPVSVSQVEDAEIIVVLSGGAKADVLRSSEVLRVSTLKDHNSTLIISGTEAIADRSSLSAVEAFFINRGIPAENIYVEDRSKNTRENAQQVVEKIGEQDFFLVTSAYHMKRAVREFDRLDASPIPAPTDFRYRHGDYRLLDYLPTSENLRKSDLAVHEYLGIIYYELSSFGN